LKPDFTDIQGICEILVVLCECYPAGPIKIYLNVLTMKSLKYPAVRIATVLFFILLVQCTAQEKKGSDFERKRKLMVKIQIESWRIARPYSTDMDQIVLDLRISRIQAKDQS